MDGGLFQMIGVWPVYLQNLTTFLRIADIDFVSRTLTSQISSMAIILYQDQSNLKILE